jgi:hypothetical protein
MISPSYLINLRAAPLSKAVLVAKRQRLATRWGECLTLTGVISAMFVVALWVALTAPARDACAFAGAVTVMLALLLGCVLHVLQLNHRARTGLLPASAWQLQCVNAARVHSVVDGYVAAVSALDRELTQSEATSIIFHGVHAAQLTARQPSKRQPGTAKL